MNSTYYLPASDEARASWLAHFAGRLPVYASKFGITAPELQAVELGHESFGAILKYQEAFYHFTKAITAAKNALRNGVAEGAVLTPLSVPTPTLPAPLAAPGVFALVSTLVSRIKATTGYTESDGVDLGIIGTEVVSRPAAVLAPVLTVVAAAQGAPDVKWRKQQQPQLELQVDRGDGHGWQLLATCTQAHFVDTHALPVAGQSAVWQYRGIFRDHDQPTGQWSAAVSTTVTG